TSRQQIGHVHVVRRESGGSEGMRHLDMAVAALFAQDGDLRAYACVDEWRCDILLRIERHEWRQTRIAGIEPGIELGIRTRRVVAQAHDLVTDFAPDAAKLSARLGPDFPGVIENFDFVSSVRLADDVRMGRQSGTTQYRHDGIPVGCSDLYDDAGLFREQRTQHGFS